MTRPEALAGAIATADRLAELRARQAELTAQLSAALRLEAFAPDIFDGGRVTVRIVGAGRAPCAAWRFEAHKASGETLSWPLYDVPPSLWPARIRSEAMADPRAKRDLARLEAKESR